MDRNVDFAAANAPGRVAAARIAAFEAASSAVVHADADPAPARMQLIAAQRLSMPARPSGSDRPAFPLELSSAMNSAVARIILVSNAELKDGWEMVHR